MTKTIGEIHWLYSNNGRSSPQHKHTDRISIEALPEYTAIKQPVFFISDKVGKRSLQPREPSAWVEEPFR